MENFIELTSKEGRKIFVYPNQCKLLFDFDNHTEIIDSIQNSDTAYLWVKETPAEIDAKISELRKRHSTPSQTDSLIVANLRAHLDELRKDYTSNEDGSIEYLKKLTSKISLLEEILSLQKPV